MMSDREWWTRRTWVLALGLLLVAGAVSGQSLAEAAKREKERRAKVVESGPSFTDEDLKRRGEGGDSNFRSRNLQSALLDLQAEVLLREGNLRLLEHGPILLRSAPPISEGLQTIRQTHGDVAHDHALEVVAKIVEILRLRCEIVFQAVGAEPFSLLEYDDPQLGVLHRNEAYHLSLPVRK